MMHPIENEKELKYRKAQKKVEAMKGFYSHFFFFVVINAGLIGLNYVTTSGVWWFYWPLLGWSLGLFSHFASVFVLPKIWGKEWEERKIKKLMDRD